MKVDCILNLQIIDWHVNKIWCYLIEILNRADNGNKIRQVNLQWQARREERQGHHSSNNRKMKWPSLPVWLFLNLSYKGPLYSDTMLQPTHFFSRLMHVLSLHCGPIFTYRNFTKCYLSNSHKYYPRFNTHRLEKSSHIILLQLCGHKMKSNIFTIRFQRLLWWSSRPFLSSRLVQKSGMCTRCSIQDYF